MNMGWLIDQAGQEHQMKLSAIILFAAQAAIGQTGGGSIAGAVTGTESLKPVASAWVTAVRTGTPNVGPVPTVRSGAQHRVDKSLRLG